MSACPNGLTENAGSTSRVIRVTTANTRIECQNIVGCLSIEAPNVTVSNVKIACTSGRTGEAANGTAVIFIDDGASATIDRVEINGMSGVHSCIWHQGTSMTARAVNCYKVNDGIFSWANKSYSQTTGDNFTITDSYFHDFTTKTANGHADGYQTEGAGNGLIRHNTYLMTSDAQNDSNSAIAIWNSLRSSHDIVVQSNLIAGGGFSIYAEDYSPSESSPAGGYTVTDISFSDNVFSNHLFGCVGYYGVWFPRGRPTDGWQRQGNVLLETGANLDSPTRPTRDASATDHVWHEVDGDFLQQNRYAARSRSAAPNALGVEDDFALKQVARQSLELVVLDQHHDHVGIGDGVGCSLQPHIVHGCQLGR